MEDSRHIVGTEKCSSELQGAPGVPDTIPSLPTPYLGTSFQPLGTDRSPIEFQCTDSINSTESRN